MSQMNIRIAVATHKKYTMPDADIYMPMEVGSVLKAKDLKYPTDSTGDNISSKNLNYCELTALYWLWKNDQSDYKGLVHYRRHFSKRKSFSDFKQGEFELVLDRKTLENLLKTEKIILPKPRKYYIETNYSHYIHSHYEKDLLKTKEIIGKKYSSYLPAFEKVMNKRSAHMFNMFVMQKEYFDAYCEWLFAILFDLESNIDISEYDYVEGRVFGYISELLLDVWIEKNGYHYVEVPVMFMEKQNWISKISSFFYRKIRSTKL